MDAGTGILEHESSVMPRRDGSNDTEAKSRALCRSLWVTPIEWLEHRFTFGFRNPTAIIGNDERGFDAVVTNLYANARPLRRVSRSIFNQVGQRLCQQVPVTVHVRRLGCKFNGSPLSFHVWAIRVDDTFGDLCEVDASKLGTVGALEFSEPQHRVEGAEQVIYFRFGTLNESGVAWIGGQLGAQTLERVFDVRQRRAQIVCNTGRNASHARDQPFEMFEHGVERNCQL